MDEDFQDPFHLQIALCGVDMWLLPYQQHLENQEVPGDKEPPSNLDQSPTQPWHLPALLGHPTEARPGPSSDSGPSAAGGQVMWGERKPRLRGSHTRCEQEPTGDTLLCLSMTPTRSHGMGEVGNSGPYCV